MAKNRATQIAKTQKVLKKHFSPVATPERTVLEHLIYGCCLENATYKKADAAFEKIRAAAYDWNEVRVTAVSELAEYMTGYVEPKRSASNLRNVLHNVFESYYSFDIDALRKQNLGKTVKELEEHDGMTPFILGYFVQNALGGHSIPMDRGSLDVLYIGGVIDEKERKKNAVPGLERAISKKQGVAFGSLLHQLGAMLTASPFSPAVREILMEIDKDCKERLPKRKSKKKAVEKKPEPKPAKVEKSKPARESKATKKTAAEKKSTKKAKAVKATKKTAKAKATKTKDAKKTAAKKKKTVKKASSVKKAGKKAGKKNTRKKAAKKAAKKTTKKKRK